MFEHLDDSRGVSPDEERRALVAARARRLVVRRRAVVGACAIALVTAVMIPVTWAQGSKEANDVRTIGQPDTTEAARDEATDTSAVTTSISAPSQVPRPTTTLSSPVCRNSFDERCGPFSWDPDPAPNAPLRLSITVTPATPRVGEKVTFEVVGEDPDADRLPCGVPPVDYGDGKNNAGWNTFCGSFRVVRSERAYGPWTPPPRLAGTFRSMAFEHNYEQPGTYIVRYSWATGPVPAGYTSPWEGGLWPADSQGQAIDPYASSATATFEIRVLP